MIEPSIYARALVQLHFTTGRNSHLLSHMPESFMASLLDKWIRDGLITIDDVIQKAFSSPEAWDRTADLIAIYTGRGEPLPKDLACFAHAVIRGDISRPKGAGRKSNLQRDLGIVFCMKRLLKEYPDLSATRNRESQGESASSLMSIALQTEGVTGLSESAVSKIWEHSKNRHTEQVGKFALDCLPKPKAER